VVEEKGSDANHTAKTKLTRRDKIAIAVLIGGFAVPDDRDHSQPANLQRLSGLGAGPRQSRFLRKEKCRRRG